jgi:uncharacterized protein YcbX
VAPRRCNNNELTVLSHLSQIILYPIKSLDGIAVSEATVSPGGALEYDRSYAILDERGKQVRGKSNNMVHLLRTVYDLNAQTVTLSKHGESEPFPFHLQTERRKIESWLSDYFGFRVYLVHNAHLGYPDDRKAWGPTVVSEASLEMVASWFPELRSSDLKRRFRPNLVITGVPAFWEDRLFGEPGTYVPFRIGSVALEGVNPCSRCVVPTRNPETAEEFARFQKTFAERRREFLPPWSSPSRFDHFYRFCVNTRIHPSEAGKWLREGDTVVGGL